MENEKILILDTETCGNVNVDDSFCYDIGFIVADYQGNIYEKHSYTIADFFLDREMMETAYYKDKIDSYWQDIKNGTRKLRQLKTVKFIIRDICTQYNITKMYAFNVKFDYDTLLKSERLTTSSKYRYFLPYQVKPFDIMNYAKELAKTNEYKQFCQDNNYLTKNGRSQIKAEVVARYLFDNNFQEEHQGLEDCEIEYDILCTLRNMYPNVDDRLWKD